MLFVAVPVTESGLLNSPKTKMINGIMLVIFQLSSVFFGCTGPYTLGPCLRKCLRMHMRNGKGTYTGVFLDEVPRVPPQSSLLDGHVLVNHGKSASATLPTCAASQGVPSNA